MTFFEMIALGASMAVDTMCAGASDGIKEQKLPFIKAILIALSFGIFQAGMSILGYFVGSFLKDTLLQYIPYIAFTVLFLLAIKTLLEALKEARERKRNGEDQIQSGKVGIVEILVQSVATSIDALSIGFVYLYINLTTAMITFMVIGITTFLLSFLAILFGKLIGSKVQKFAPYVSALIFLGLAIKFLVEGLL